MYQQLWGYKVEEKLYLGVREQKRLITTGLDDAEHDFQQLEVRNWTLKARNRVDWTTVLREAKVQFGL
jgi:hypothetical protein